MHNVNDIPKLENCQLFPGGVYRHSEDSLPANRNIEDIRLLEGLILKDMNRKMSRDFRKISSPNFRKMSFDRIRGDRKEKPINFQTTSLEFRRTSESQKSEQRKNSEHGYDLSGTSTTNAASENPKRIKYNKTKLYYSRSEDYRTQPFEKYSKVPQPSRVSHSSQDVVGDGSCDYDFEYFTKNLADNEEIDKRRTAAPDTSCIAVMLSDDLEQPDALHEEPELESLAEPDRETRIYLEGRDRTDLEIIENIAKQDIETGDNPSSPSEKLEAEDEYQETDNCQSITNPAVGYDLK